MAGRSAALFTLTLLLAVKMVLPQRSGGYTCIHTSQDLFNCLENPRIRISKNTRNYIIRLCLDEDCSTVTEDSRLNWFACRDICDACIALLGTEAGRNQPVTVTTICTLTEEV